MTRSEWINIIGIAVMTLTIRAVVIQQFGGILSELHMMESRLDAKIGSGFERLE